MPHNFDNYNFDDFNNSGNFNSANFNSDDSSNSNSSDFNAANSNNFNSANFNNNFNSSNFNSNSTNFNASNFNTFPPDDEKFSNSRAMTHINAPLIENFSPGAIPPFWQLIKRQLVTLLKNYKLWIIWACALIVTIGLLFVRHYFSFPYMLGISPYFADTAIKTSLVAFMALLGGVTYLCAPLSRPNTLSSLRFLYKTTYRLLIAQCVIVGSAVLIISVPYLLISYTISFILAQIWHYSWESSAAGILVVIISQLIAFLFLSIYCLLFAFMCKNSLWGLGLFGLSFLVSMAIAALVSFVSRLFGLLLYWIVLIALIAPLSLNNLSLFGLVISIFISIVVLLIWYFLLLKITHMCLRTIR